MTIIAVIGGKALPVGHLLRLKWLHYHFYPCVYTDGAAFFSSCTCINTSDAGAGACKNYRVCIAFVSLV